MDALDKLLDEYKEKFKEQFPLMLCRTMDDDEIIEIIKECMEKGISYEPELDKEANY